MMFGNRQGLIVWVNSMKYVKQLRRYGNVHYASRKMKYAVLYIDMDKGKEMIQKLESLHYVKKVEESFKPFIKTTFENSRPDKEKEEQDYKIGL